MSDDIDDPEFLARLARKRDQVAACRELASSIAESAVDAFSKALPHVRLSLEDWRKLGAIIDEAVGDHVEHAWVPGRIDW